MPKHHARSIVWFRRDLRVTDQTALLHAAEASKEIIPVCIVSTWKRRHGWTGAGRQQFLSGCLEALEKDLLELGAQLVYREGPAVEAIETLIKETKASALFLNRDPDPHGIAVEKRLRERCRYHGIDYHDYKDLALHERDEILTNEGRPYRVYTPYGKNWFAREKEAPKKKPKALAGPAGIRSTECPTLDHWQLDAKDLPEELPVPGERAARRRLEKALRGPLRRYADDRDCPAGQTTSRLSQDLRWGLVSIREVYAKTAGLLDSTKNDTVRRSCRVFLQELAWRDFYMQILWHHPEVLDEPFNADYADLPWAWDDERFQRWAEGSTGFPIVDAGMRQLAATGFMHNRVRMITAMFLTKDLRIHWRKGEAHFMRHLIDGEIASNNGGWQWSAGTGADAAPYFRIQNPWTQTKRHDPSGHYIKRWVEDLADAPAKALFTAPQTGESVSKGYPPPIVDHHAEREKTLAFFKKHRKG